MQYHELIAHDAVILFVPVVLEYRNETVFRNKVQYRARDEHVSAEPGDADVIGGEFKPGHVHQDVVLEWR